MAVKRMTTLFLICFSTLSEPSFEFTISPIFSHKTRTEHIPIEHKNGHQKNSRSILPQKSIEDDEDFGDEESDIDISDRDWRAFRAQLVMKDSTTTDTEESSQDHSEQNIEGSESAVFDDDLDGIGVLFNDEETPMSTTNFTPLDPVQWAYDSGHVIEQGAVILGGVEQDFGFGLRQQYFHKAVILVLDHDENTFTKGIILNRPTDLLLVDEDDNKWRIWYGGDVQNLNHAVPDIVCLHSMKGDDEVDKLSKIVMKDIQFCSFEDAKKLVNEKKAKTNDFWCFAGYAGWGPGQLFGELNRKSWYMCATDSQTLLKELAKQSAFTDPRDAGLDTWELLMNLIGRGATADECSGDFEDLMLKEWARAHLLSVEAGGTAGIRLQPQDIASSSKTLVQGVTMDDAMKETVASVKANSVKVGSLIRGSSSERSHFLLQNQEFHKSIILIIAQDNQTSVGLILNHPSSKSLEMELVDRKTSKKKEILIPLRFGGQYAIRGQDSLIWLHNSPILREAKVGSPVGEFNIDSCIWKCKQDDATAAISAGLAKPRDFLIVSGLSIWINGQRDAYSGLKGEVSQGRYELVPSGKISKVWEHLLSQEPLTKLNLLRNLDHGNNAWEAGGKIDVTTDEAVVSGHPITVGIGEGFDEDNDTLVFKSEVRVNKLSDLALRSWVATYLLGSPTLGA